MSTTRREFLKSGIGSATLLATGASLPGFLTRTARAATPATDDRILVVVQMTGGNDGLNTVIPYADDIYHRARPTLGIGRDRVHKLDDALGLHPGMVGFKRMFDDGLLSVVTNVGYPNPDRSHFSSMDIWHCAETNAKRAQDGWLGRVVDRTARPGAAPFALHLDHEILPLALKTRKRPVPSINDIAAFQLRGDTDALADAIKLRRGGDFAGLGGQSSTPTGSERAHATRSPSALDDLLFVQRTAIASCANARRIEQIADRATQRGRYPDYGLANRLSQIARLISANFGARIYYTSLGGFDTHARQVLAHGGLLRELSESVAAFHADLRERGQAERVVLMTFSEFGRRVKENGSQGTDHGAAAPMFLVGPGCSPGIHGSPPDLSDLLEGDVRHETDFRRVYAAILDDWLRVGQSGILGQNFEPLGVVGS